MILCVMSLFLVACTNKNDKTKVKMEETQEMETAAVLEPDLAQIRSICDLATLECYYHNVAKSTKEKGSGLAHLGEKERKFWIEYTGVVKIGIEMSDVKMDVNGTSVQITIPRAKIFQPDPLFPNTPQYPHPQKKKYVYFAKSPILCYHTK